MDYNIEQKETGGNGMFYIEHDTEIVAELQYTVQDHGIMTLDHTETHPSMSGKGLAKKLVKHAVDYARNKKLKIDPLCSYAATQFDRNEDYQDVRVD